MRIHGCALFLLASSDAFMVRQAPTFIAVKKISVAPRHTVQLRSTKNRESRFANFSEYAEEIVTGSNSTTADLERENTEPAKGLTLEVNTDSAHTETSTVASDSPEAKELFTHVDATVHSSDDTVPIVFDASGFPEGEEHFFVDAIVNSSEAVNMIFDDVDGLGAALQDFEDSNVLGVDLGGRQEGNDIDSYSVNVQSSATSEPAILDDASVDSTAHEEAVIMEDADVFGAALEESRNNGTLGIELEICEEDNENAMQLLVELDIEESEKGTQEVLDGTGEKAETGTSINELCIDERKKRGFRARLKGVIGRSLQVLRGKPSIVDEVDAEAIGRDISDNVEGNLLEEEEESKTEIGPPEIVDFRDNAESNSLEEEVKAEIDFPDILEGDLLELGWYTRGRYSAFRRNAEVWKFALKCVFRCLKPRSLRNKGASEEEVKQAEIDAATFVRDGLLTLGPTFVKLGQVVSTRADVLPAAYADVLKTLQDEVPAFSGARAKELFSWELGRPVDELFTDFSEEPLKAASLAQVHTAYYQGKKVAIKVQRAGLEELFDVDLKNLRKLAVLLDKFDPKTGGADRDWVGIYEESQRLLYLEIDFLNEADHCERFYNDFSKVPYVRVPRVYREVSTSRVLVMEFVESFKLTDIKRIEKLGLDRKKLAKRMADSFLRQILETSFFHCDPHPGNLCVDEKGNLVYYDFGMMDELKPNVREGFRKFSTALFAGGPVISDLELARNAKQLVDGVEVAGVLACGADRLAAEKLARYFMRSFKDLQLGKEAANMKETVGLDLQTLTENDVFRIPSTFSFILRAFTSIEGVGKGLDEDYDIVKHAQPFIEKFMDKKQDYNVAAGKAFSLFGLNGKGIETAVNSPKKIAYIEETVRSMEDGSLKIRVRSLENEKALERMELTQSRSDNLLLATGSLNASILACVAGFASRKLLSSAGYAGFVFFAFQAFLANGKVKNFDKTRAKYSTSKFTGDD